ncbi:MAG: hypothetical protein ABSB59_09310 [Streptosporangiaceae bacterium]
MGIGIALIRRYAQAVPAGQAARGDRPERLLRWAAGLLSARRAEWGQAMIGELDHIDGRGRRWRFAVGCAGATLLMPPWGRAAAAVQAMAVAAAGGAGVEAAVAVRYRLGGGGGLVFEVIELVFLAAFTLAAVTLLRRPGLALPGLLGGAVVALTWLAMQGFTFYDVIAPWIAPFWPLVPMVAVPAAVGAAGALWAGSAVDGRRIARLAAISAGLGLYLYGAIAVAVLGAGGPPGTPGWTGGQNVGDRLANNMTENLLVIPLVTATIGWAAAAATARLRLRPAASVLPVPLPATGWASEENQRSIPSPPEPAPAGRPRPRPWRRAAWLLLLSAGVAAAAFLTVISGLRG